MQAGFPTTAARINRDHVETFIADQVERWRPSTALTRYGAPMQFFKWWVEDGEIPESPPRFRRLATVRIERLGRLPGRPH